MAKHRSCALRLFALLSAVSIAPHAWCQTYPAKPILITIGLQAATGSDIAVRTIAERMSALLGQQIVMSTEARKVARQPDLQTRWSSIGLEPRDMPPEQLGNLMRDESASNAKIIAAKGIRGD